MKNLLYIFLVFGILLSSCDEEEGNPFSPTSTFSCMIDGVQLSDSSPIGVILTTNPALNGALEISGVSNLKDGMVMNNVYITIYNFDSVTENTTLSLGSSGSGVVSKNTYVFSTSSPNFTGTARFSKITANKVSGTFSFEALNTDPTIFTKVVVTQGSFTDVSY